MTVEPPVCPSGFGNLFATEALRGAPPVGRPLHLPCAFVQWASNVQVS